MVEHIGLYQSIITSSNTRVQLWGAPSRKQCRRQWSEVWRVVENCWSSGQGHAMKSVVKVTYSNSPLASLTFTSTCITSARFIKALSYGVQRAMHWNKDLPDESGNKKWLSVSVCNKKNCTHYLGNIISCICSFVPFCRNRLYVCMYILIFLNSDVSHASVVCSFSLNLFIYLRGFSFPLRRPRHAHGENWHFVGYEDANISMLQIESKYFKLTI